MIGLLSAVFNISVCVGFPITVFIVLLAKSKKLNTELKIFIVGICTYLAAQILFRQPLLAILQNIDSYRILISNKSGGLCCCFSSYSGMCGRSRAIYSISLFREKS